MKLCFSALVGTESRRQQFFRTTPGDSFVPEGGRAILTCVIGDLGGRVQWTKDGLTLGEEFMIFKRSDNDDDDDQGPRTNVQGRAYTRYGIYD